MKLWSGVLSNNAAKVRIALREKGLAFETLNIDWSRANAWGDKPAAFCEVSPRGQVPVLIDDDITVHDSTVINEYLEERYPEPPLFPKEPVPRTECRQWEDEADHVGNTHVAVLISDVFLAGSETEASSQAVAAINAYYTRLDARLAEKDYLCDTFTVADIATFLTLGFAATLGAPFTGYPNVAAWHERVLARPVVRSEYEAIMAAAAAA